MTQHIMVDIETLGSKPGSVIISIGACRFDPAGGAITDTFHQAIDPASAQRYGLRIDADTVKWWLAPGRGAAREAWLKLPQVALDEALLGFSAWIEHRALDEALLGFSAWIEHRAPGERSCIWGNGADFDCVQLRLAYEVCGLDPPWSFRDHRCFRTLKSLAPTDLVPGVEPEWGSDVQHDALADAVHQARYAQRIFGVLDAAEITA